MQQKNIIQAQNIALNLEAESELETIAAMLELVEDSGTIENVQQLSDDLLTREIFDRTTTSHCALLFHVISRSVPHLQLYFGRFAKGIGYFSHSGHPIDLLFLLVANPTEAEEFENVLEKLENALQDPATRNAFRNASTKDYIRKQLEKIFIN